MTEDSHFDLTPQELIAQSHREGNHRLANAMQYMLDEHQESLEDVDIPNMEGSTEAAFIIGTVFGVVWQTHDVRTGKVDIPSDGQRTTVVENGPTDEIHIEGIDTGDGGAARVAIDYCLDRRRVIVHADDSEKPTHVIELENGADNDDDDDDSGGDFDEGGVIVGG